jgi:hypothetical protein
MHGKHFDAAVTDSVHYWTIENSEIFSERASLVPQTSTKERLVEIKS